MEIKINIDETKFQEVLEKELDAFSEEEIKEILQQAMKEYLAKEDVLRAFLEREEKDYYGRCKSGTSAMDKMVAAVDLNDVFAEPKKKILEIVGTDENLKSAAVQILVGMFKDRFRSAMLGDYQFIQDVSIQVEQALLQRRGNS